MRVLVRVPLLGALLGALLGSLAACGADERGTPAEARAPVEVEAAADRTVATVGDRILFTVTVDRASDVEIEIPPLDPELEGLTAIESEAEEVEAGPQGGRTVEEHRVRLRVDRVGSYELAPVKIRYRLRSPEPAASPARDGSEGDPQSSPRSASPGDSATEEAGWETVETAPVSVEVESLLERAEQAGEPVADIRGLKPLERPEPPLPWPWIAGGGVLAAGLAALLLWLRRRTADETRAPPRPAHEVALERLEALARLDRTDPETVHRLHFELSEVVRTYVESRFGLNATDLTTEEIVVALPRLPDLEGDTACRLRRFLVDTDRVKFADHRPPESEIETAFERARRFIEATRPRPEEPESETGRKAARGLGNDGREVAA